jgi:hypothetical protein
MTPEQLLILALVGLVAGFLASRPVTGGGRGSRFSYIHTRR